MAFNVAKLAGGSKLLLLPFTGIVLGGTAISYGTYKISRSWTGSSLGVEFDSAGTICQTVATIGGISAAGGFLLARRANYRPLPFNVIVEQMEKEFHNSGQYMTRTVTAGGEVLHTTLERRNPRPSSYSGWVHDIQTRTQLLLRAARVPARFWMVNIVGGAAIAGSVTSLAQRFVCGKTGSGGEVGNFVKISETKLAANRPNPKEMPVTVQTQPTQQVTSTREDKDETI